MLLILVVVNIVENIKANTKANCFVLALKPLIIWYDATCFYCNSKPTFFFTLLAQPTSKASFKVVPLGVKGGIDESNLSAYLLAPVGTTEFICLDAGTIHSGIQKAIENNTFKANHATVLKQYIKGYFISHAHLDHVAGLIINSPEDSAKNVYALPACMQMLQNFYFNGEGWTNFGDEGKGFLVKKYHFNTLQPNVTTPIVNTAMEVKTFPLSHINPFESAAFLVSKDDAFVLYLGDTGADEIEKSDKLQLLWKEIAPLVMSKKLKGIFIEVSFPNEQPDDKLFGHLTPLLFYQEMNKLADLTGVAAIKELKIVITHNKPPAANIGKIKIQLNAANMLALKLIFPEQGRGFTL
ncbi:MAG: 3',5'-cyclic-nucleotide phosphodiesterase [Bacteroidota bacterium]